MSLIPSCTAIALFRQFLVLISVTGIWGQQELRFGQEGSVDSHFLPQPSTSTPLQCAWWLAFSPTIDIRGVVCHLYIYFHILIYMRTKESFCGKWD